MTGDQPNERALSIRDPRETEIVRALGGQITDVVETAKSAVVDGPQGLEWATAILGEIKKHRDRVEELRVTFTRPLNDHVRTVNGFFKGMDAPLAEADTTLRQRVLDYRKRVAEEQRMAEVERTRLEAEAAKREAEAQRALQTAPDGDARAALEAADAAHALAAAAAVPDLAPRTVRTALGSSTARRVWDFEVVDLAAIPKDYLIVSEGAVRDAIRSGAREIPGLRIFEREVLVVKS